MLKVLLLTPPLLQLNTPYPATPYLTGFLRRQGVDVHQADMGIVWFLHMFQPHNLRALCAQLQGDHPSVVHMRKHIEKTASVMPYVLSFLQGKDSSLCARIAKRSYVPEGPRFARMAPEGYEQEYLDWAFGGLGIQDRAQFFATLFLEDVVDAVQHGLDPHVDFARYGESLAQSQPTLDPLLEHIEKSAHWMTTGFLKEVTHAVWLQHKPDVVGLSIPFPGNVLGALQISQWIKKWSPSTRVVWGGGYVNTELRSLSDPRLFAWVDALTYDDGEQPLLKLLGFFEGKTTAQTLVRTRVCEEGQVVYHEGEATPPLPFAEVGCPSYEGLPLDAYVKMFDVLNPMQRMWSDTRWNKIIVAHGCYWKKCSFCDVTLPYIADYQPLQAHVLVDHIETLIQQTQQRGFHCVDEAAPPASLRSMAKVLCERGVDIAWWGNIRFEKAFDAETCKLLAQSGCVAVSGGLEVASNRLLKYMQKGVTVEQVARVTKHFANAGVMVHAYVMYGFPSQTLQETIDSLEMVRQMFQEGCLDSAFWHRFSVTAHSPIGKNPQQYGIRLLPMPEVSFAQNDLAFEDPHGCDPSPLGPALHKAVFNYMMGMGVEEDVRSWFDVKVPKTTVHPLFIQRALEGI
jgi:hypothetical protein